MFQCLPWKLYPLMQTETDNITNYAGSSWMLKIVWVRIVVPISQLKGVILIKAIQKVVLILWLFWIGFFGFFFF